MCLGWGAQPAPKAALQGLQPAEGPGVALALGAAAGPHQLKLLLHMLQLKVETPPVGIVLPRVTWAWRLFWRTRERKRLSWCPRTERTACQNDSSVSDGFLVSSACCVPCRERPGLRKMGRGTRLPWPVSTCRLLLTFYQGHSQSFLPHGQKRTE